MRDPDRAVRHVAVLAAAAPAAHGFHAALAQKGFVGGGNDERRRVD